jgi:hypothetical protein
MKHGHGHAAWTWKCSMDMDVQHGHDRAPDEYGHKVRNWTCSMDLPNVQSVLHGHRQVHAACPSRVETKMFVFVFFAKIFLRKLMKITKIFAKIRKNRIFFITLQSTLASGLWKRNFSFICLSILQFLISHVRIALDSQEGTVSVGF